MRAFRFAVRHGMGWMFLVPVLCWALLTWAVFAWVDDLTAAATQWVGVRLGLPAESTPPGDDWQELLATLKALVNGARDVLVWLLVRLAVLYLLYRVGKYIVLILLSPLLAYASERAEEVLTGVSHPFSWGRLLKDALRGSLVALRNGFLELVIGIAVWVATLFVPLLAPIAVPLLFVVSAYFYGFSMFDYVFERRRMRIGETVRAVNLRFGAVVANGTCFALLMKIPLLGVMFAPVMASIGAVIAEVRREERS
jgi:CysZ protein